MSSSIDIVDMQERLRNKRNILSKRAHSKENDTGILYFGRSKRIRFRKTAKTELDKLKTQLDLDLKRQKRFEIVLLVVAVVTFVTAFSMFAQNFI